MNRDVEDNATTSQAQKAAGRRSVFRLDLPQLLMLVAVVGGALIIIGSRLTWGRLALPAVGPIPPVVFVIDGSSSGRHGDRILVVGVVIAAIAVASFVLRPLLLRAGPGWAKAAMAAASILLIAASVYAAWLAEREVEGIHDRGRLAREFHLGFLSKYASTEAGLPTIFAGAGVAAVAGLAAAIVIILRRRDITGP